MPSGSSDAARPGLSDRAMELWRALTPAQRLAAACAAVLALAALVVAAAHVRLYYRGPGGPGAAAVTMIQASAADVTPEMLGERQPIVLMDELFVPDHRALRAALFRWQGVVGARVRSGAAAAAGGCTRARFTLLSCFADARGADVSIRPAGSPGDHLEVVVRLAQGRTLVLPPRWAWSVGDGRALFETALHDPVSAALSALGIAGVGCSPP